MTKWWTSALIAVTVAGSALRADIVSADQASAEGAAAQACLAATVWASPQVVNYKTVIKDAGKHPSEPSFTVFIELPDGSAADIDRGSVTLDGVPALAKPSGVADANENGIADLMVKFDRSALLTTEGLLTITGQTRDGTCFAGQTSIEILWCSVERSDYFIDFTNSDREDQNFKNLPARLDVHRVKPGPGCPTAAVLVLVHGQTVPASAAFDLQYGDYSLMERLAMRGIDTFAANNLGMGFSALVDRPNPLDDPCNASLPQCGVPIGGTCAAVAGVCDCRNGLADTFKVDQQRSPRYLNPNPLPAACPHTMSTQFQAVTDMVEQLEHVVDDARARTGAAKVHLLGLSLGGPVVGKYVGVPGHEDKVAGVVFLASTFRGNTATPSPTWPLGLIDHTDVANLFNLTGPSCLAGDGCATGCAVPDPDCAKGLLGCPGQEDAQVPDALWEAIKARDPIGPSWGPQPDGLSRYPVVPRFGWNETVTSQITVPALVLNGLKDSVVRVAASPEIWSSSPLQVPSTACTSDAQCTAGYACKSFLGSASCRLDNRVLQQLDCASHALLWETCAGEGCVDPHRTVQKRIGDWILTGK